ncbi:MAG: helix-turn-helix transcriptional regulator [Alistipes sp.]|nr:helix-turn-helix transcriptional regulator [Alistipes sp.]
MKKSHSFITEKEAMRFIKKMYGEDAEVKRSTYTGDTCDFEHNEVPYTVSGELSCFVVNDEIIVAYHEPIFAEYTLYIDGRQIEKFDSLFAAREAFQEVIELSEEENSLCHVQLYDEGKELIEDVTTTIDDEIDVVPSLTVVVRYKQTKLAAEIKAKISQSNYSYRQLSALTGMSKTTIQSITNGDNFTVENLLLLGQVLDFDVKI